MRAINLLIILVFSISGLFAQQPVTPKDSIDSDSNVQLADTGQISVAKPAAVDSPVIIPESPETLVIEKTKIETMIVVRDPPAPEPKKQAFSAVSRSFLVPGWGQFHSKKKVRGAVIVGVVAGSLVSGIVCNRKASQYYDEYQNARYGFDDKYDRADMWLRATNVSILCGLTAWVYSVIDASFSNKEDTR